MKWLFLSLNFLICFKTLSQSSEQQAQKFYQDAFDHYKREELGLARSMVEESLVKYETPHARYLSGLIFEEESRELRAVSEYEAAVKLNPEYREAIFKKALIYLRFGDPEQAVKDLTYLINTYNQFHETTSILFQIDESGGNQNKILTTNMLEARLYYNRAQAYQKLDKSALAITDFNSAISLEKSSDFLIGRGLLHLDNKSNELAISDFRQVISMDSTNHLAWYNLAIADDNTMIPTSLILGAEFAPTLSLLATKEMEKGDLNKAKAYLDKALEINQTDQLSLVNRGRLLLKLKQYDKARNDFNQVLKVNPRKIESLYLIGNAYFFEERFENALAYYSQYLAIDGINGMVWYNAAMCHFELENEAEGCHHLEMADQMGMTQARSMLSIHCK